MFRRSSSKRPKPAVSAGATSLSQPSGFEGPDFSAILGGYELPCFPRAVAHALAQLADPDVDMLAVSTVVEGDPGATIRLLRLVNTASFSPRSKVTSVHQGAVLLGRNQLESLLISIGAHNALPDPVCEGFEKDRFWMAAARRAVLARTIAERTDPTRTSENFTAALLQDMGIPVLALRAHRYGEVLSQWHNSTAELVDLETASYGWHHGTVAGWMGASWAFPEEFISFIGDHHSEEDLEHLLPARVVSPIREVGTAGDEEVIEQASARLNLSSDETHGLIKESAGEAAQLAHLLN